MAELDVVLGLEGLALGGCPINALDLGRTLAGRGHRVSVFAIDEEVKVSVLPYAERSGLPVEILPREAGVAARAAQIRTFASDHGADIVHVFAPWLAPAALVAAMTRARTAAVTTNWMMANVPYVPSGTPLIVGTRQMQQEAARTHGGPVWLMEPPVDLDTDAPDPVAGWQFRADRGIADDEVAAVIVSRLDAHMKREGIAYAIRAVGKLDLPGLRLVVVGDGNAFDDLQSLARDVNATLGRPAVLLTGALADPRPAYSAADLVLAMGGSALRALAHGKPLIVLGERGFARRFDPVNAAYFYDAGFFGTEAPEDPVGHLAALMASLADHDTRTRLGAFGAREVRARFGLSTGADLLERIYHAALAAAPAGPARWWPAAQVLGRMEAHQAVHRLRRLRPTGPRAEAPTASPAGI